MVEQVLPTVKSGVVWMFETLIAALPVLSSVRVCGAETLGARVFAKVRELCDAAKAEMGGVFEGVSTNVGVEVPGEVNEVRARCGVAFDHERAGVGC